MTPIIDPYKTGGFDPNYPANIRTYYAPVDKVHAAILDAVKSAKHSLVMGMYGLDDEEIVAAILEKMKDENVYVQLTLDSSQAAGVHEKAILQKYVFPATSIAIGRSEKNAIIHIKIIVVDNVKLITGSTNLSTGGEYLQDNDCIIISDPYVAGEAVSRISAIHANILAKVATSPTMTDDEILVNEARIAADEKTIADAQADEDAANSDGEAESNK